jgi:hypothetical protein
MIDLDLTRQNSTNALIREWITRVQMRELLRSGRASALLVRSKTSEVFGEACSVEDLTQEAQLKLWLSLQTVVELSLFFAVLSFIWANVSRFATTDFRLLARLRDTIKSLNPPVKIFPQSLHPIKLAA